MGEKMKEESIKLLNLIYQNSQMGVLNIETVLKKIKDEKIAKLVKSQQLEYDKISKMAINLLAKYDQEPKNISKMKELSSKVMGEAMTMNADDKKIVKLMMSGNERGLIEIQENINSYDKSESEILNLAQKLLATEEHNREEFKKYL